MIFFSPACARLGLVFRMEVCPVIKEEKKKIRRHMRQCNQVVQQELVLQLYGCTTGRSITPLLEGEFNVIHLPSDTQLVGLFIRLNNA